MDFKRSYPGATAVPKATGVPPWEDDRPGSPAGPARGDDRPGSPAGVVPSTAKILIAGGFGVGKTTLVGAITEIRPLRTEETLSDRGVGVDDISLVDRKTTTTVAMDFGRITFRAGLALYLFGMPGQERFWFMWEELSHGAIGAVVLADTRRLTSCFASVDYFEQTGTPFVVAVNCFDDSPHHEPGDVRVALDLDPGTPVLLCDARQRDSVKNVLIALVKLALSKTAADPEMVR